MNSIPNASLGTALAALKQGNYQEAIAHLENVCETELDESIVSKASKALVEAYRRNGEHHKAKALCQRLAQDPDPKLKEWATRSLAEFASTEALAVESSTSSASLLPVPYSATSTAIPSLYTPRPRWRNSGRPKQRRTLKPPKLRRLWLVEIGTAIAVFWLLRFCLQLGMRTTNNILVKLPFLQPLQLFYRDPSTSIYILLAFLLILSPWLIDALLRWFHGLEKLSLPQLASRSPESAEILQRFCQQRKLPLPKLGLLTTKIPVALTYGNLPQTARIVVSEGLLEQLQDDEIATIYAGQLGHIVHWDFILMSLGTLIIQIPYIIYYQVALWGEKLPDLLERKWSSYPKLLGDIILGITSIISSFSYGIYWLLRLPLLWFSRVRLYYSDRLAIETTGNPNGLTRALLKIALGISQDIQVFGATGKLLEGYDLLLPVGYKQAITIGSCSPSTPFEEILKWDCINPYRDWLIISASHPLMGERLQLPTRYAQFLQVETELDLPNLSSPPRNSAARLSKLKKSYQALPLLQSCVLFGLIVGLILRAIFWLIGKISYYLYIWQFVWMSNAAPFLDACVLVAFSLCAFIWINNYFPDIKGSKVWKQPNLATFFANPYTLAPDSQPIQLTGRLLGRGGLLNWLGQDLILQTSTGLVKLHYFSFLGPAGNLLPISTRPSDLVDKEVTVTGWFRRGATPWIDVETLRTEDKKISRANYPVWITILALAAAIWGAYQVWQLSP
ncbi:MAG: zinc metalloprotease HtpX [Coleofasciculaceae cyanobacterium]